MHDCANRRRVVILQIAPEPVHQQLARHRIYELFRMRDERLLQADDAVEFGAVGKRAGSVDLVIAIAIAPLDRRRDDIVDERGSDWRVTGRLSAGDEKNKRGAPKTRKCPRPLTRAGTTV